MKHRPLQFAKRQMHTIMVSPLLWVALAGAAVVLGLAGPFGTFEALSLPARLGYWALIVTSTYLTGYLAVCLLEALTHAGDSRPSPAAFALYGAIAGIPVSCVVWLINLWIFNEPVISFVPLLAYTVPVAAIGSATISYFSMKLSKERDTPGIQPSTQRERPPLMDRLEPNRRGALYYLSMRDHYVEVVTSTGTSLVLMRMSDAIAETSPIEGVRIHRSHWVARDAIIKTVRTGERVFVQMADGVTLPVSRARRNDLKDAGKA